MTTRTITLAYMRRAAMAFNRATHDELDHNLRSVPTTNLAALRDAARYYGARGQILEQDTDLIVKSITAEITRRWKD